MLKLGLIGVWCATVSLASVYAAVNWRPTEVTAEEQFPVMSKHHVVKSGLVTVPIIKGSKLDGYVVAEVTLTANDQPWHHRTYPEAELTDQLLTTLQSGFPLPTDEEFTLDLIRSELVDQMNNRLGAQAYFETLVTKLDYLTLDDVARLNDPVRSRMKVIPVVKKENLDVLATDGAK